jgi:hypothetical protein
MTYIPSNYEAWDFACWAIWEHYYELRDGAKGPGVVLTPAEADRLARNIKWPPHRPPPTLDDLYARLLACGGGSSKLMLSPADCELLACNLTTPKRPKGGKLKDDIRIALHCLKLALYTENKEKAVQQTIVDYKKKVDGPVSRSVVFRALRKFGADE